MNSYKYKNLARNIASLNIKKHEALKILSFLSVHELRFLLHELKLAEEKNTLEATLVEEPSATFKNALTDKFPDSKLAINIDKKIGAGFKVRKFDMIYDFTVKSRIKNVIDALEEEIR